MFRKPEIVEIWAAGLEFLFLLWSVIFFYRSQIVDPIPLYDIAYLAFFTIGLCIFGKLFLGSVLFRYLALILHLLACFVLLATFDGRFLLIELMMTFPLILQGCLRLSMPYRPIFCGCVLFAGSYFGLSNGVTISDRITALLFGAAFYFLGEIVIRYRESLVEKRNLLTDSQQSLENLAAANQSFIEYLEHVEADSAEQERLRITRELHDSIGYALTNITMMMNAARNMIRSDLKKLDEYCFTTKNLASSTLRETREILYKLRDVGKPQAQNPVLFFSQMCYDFEKATGIVTDCNAGNLPARISEHSFNTIFRIVQVGLINALRHGSKGHIKLHFWLAESALRLTIWNSLQAGTIGNIVVNEGIGIKGIRERLEAIDGTLSLGRVVDGCQLVVYIPQRELGIEANIHSHSR